MKLRRYLRTKKLEHVRQLGVDRVVDFKFGAGEDSYHIILELYAKGNIVLTDNNFMVIALLRSHVFSAGPVTGKDSKEKHEIDEVALKVGEAYPMSELFGTQMSNQAPEADSTAVVETGSFQQLNLNNINCGYEVFVRWCQEKVYESIGFDSINSVALLAAAQGDDNLPPPAGAGDHEPRESDVAASAPAASASATSKKSVKHKKLSLRQLLLSKDSGIASLGAEIVDHCLVTAGLSPNLKLDLSNTQHIHNFIVTEDQFLLLLRVIQACHQGLVNELNKPGTAGYILCKKLAFDQSAQRNVEQTEFSHPPGQEYEEFVPYLFAQHQDRSFISFPSFDQAVDEYFCKVCRPAVWVCRLTILPLILD
jgi:hypothetical protein